MSDYVVEKIADKSEQELNEICINENKDIVRILNELVQGTPLESSVNLSGFNNIFFSPFVKKNALFSSPKIFDVKEQANSLRNSVTNSDNCKKMEDFLKDFNPFLHSNIELDVSVEPQNVKHEYKKLKKLIEDFKSPLEHYTLGEYDDSAKRILLYTNSIDQVATQYNCSPNKLLKLVYYHEFFHYYHSAIINEHSCDWSPQDSVLNCNATIVKESLAKAFELLLLIGLFDEDKNLKFVLETILWDDIKFNPYAGAPYLFNMGKLKESNFVKLLQKSISSWDEAYEYLLKQTGNIENLYLWGKIFPEYEIS